MTLADKWTVFRNKFNLNNAPPQQILFGQACYLAGAQAAFHILGAASAKTPEEAIIIWGELQREILGAVAQPKKETLVAMPPEKQLIV